MKTSRVPADLLKNVSRSFYLTLRILPVELRQPIGLAYLFARAADTIADTALIPAQHRIELVLALRAHLAGTGNTADLDRIRNEVAQQQIDTHEAELLNSLQPMFDMLKDLKQVNPADHAAVVDVVTTLSSGMEFDLYTFPDERSGRIAALDRREQLDRYTYLVAGCVGEFWTRITCRHRPELAGWDVAEMSRYGIRFGKALQMTNILRDCAHDLRIGRCYLPMELLAPAGLTADDLLQPKPAHEVQPLLRDLMRETLDHFRVAEHYTLAIPATSARLRLACLWPILIGLETLSLVARNDGCLDPAQRSKVGRAKIYLIIALSLPVIGSNAIVRAWIRRLIGKVEAQLSRH